MKIQAPRGMRDFYPEQMRVRQWIMDAWRRVSLRNGFEEYDGPIFESLDLYKVKSGEGIVSELFHFQDRGEREFAIRPEMTPTLARMVAAKAATLPKPIKWFSMPRLCRAERPQRGRLREFFQWNIDVMGEADVLADAECIFVAADFFREVGLTPEHVVIKISSREMLAAILTHIGVPLDRHDAVYAVLDKRGKVDADTYQKILGGLELAQKPTAQLLVLGDESGPQGLDKTRELLQGSADGQASLDRLDRLFHLLRAMGVAEYCRFDMSVVRGLAYYTGVVYEAYGKGSLQRAIFGGGRYDNLISSMGGPEMAAAGFAVGDVVLQEILADLDLIPTFSPSVDFFVIDDGQDCLETVLETIASLRGKNLSATYSFKRQSPAKQMKQAAGGGARRVVFVDGDTSAHRKIRVRDLLAGLQQTMTIETLLNDPFQPLHPDA